MTAYPSALTLTSGARLGAKQLRVTSRELCIESRPFGAQQEAPL